MFNVNPHCSVPKFLTKIWALVEDPKTNDFICWSQDGNSFIVLNEENFAKNILPKHFKHNNMASFVRQLNWYGFRKVMQDETGTFKQDRIGTGRYHHPFFKQGKEELLARIKRKVKKEAPNDFWQPSIEGVDQLPIPEGCVLPHTQQHFVKKEVPLPRMEDRTNGPEDVHKILSLIQQVQGRQDVVDSTVESLKRDNEALWKEVLDLRQKHFQHQQLFETMARSHSLDQVVCLQQNQPLMIDGLGHYNQLLSSKSEANRKVTETQSSCLENREVALQPMGRCSVKEEEPSHSSEDELEDSWANKTENKRLKQILHSNCGRSSSETEDLGKIHAIASSTCNLSANQLLSSARNPASRLASGQLFHKAIKPEKNELPESKSRLSKDSDFDAYEGGDALDISELDDIEDQDDSRTSSSGFGHMRKRRKVNDSAGQKIGHLLDQMHKDNLELTKRVLALEEQSLQKLSEISTTLSTLTNFFMNTHHNQSPLQQSLFPNVQLPSKPEDMSNTYQTPS
ncbi:heat shock factor protein 2-like isoform X1 [Pleurodeles waltl]|uniref:heat shock factor protein 2-like isoform X1 n=1 Tax=Pleurodeles waltl TaxID=8319 RepID=UPI003709BE7D